MLARKHMSNFEMKEAICHIFACICMKFSGFQHWYDSESTYTLVCKQINVCLHTRTSTALEWSKLETWHFACIHNEPLWFQPWYIESTCVLAHKHVDIFGLMQARNLKFCMHTWWTLSISTLIKRIHMQAPAHLWNEGS